MLLDRPVLSSPKTGIRKTQPFRLSTCEEFAHDILENNHIRVHMLSTDFMYNLMNSEYSGVVPNLVSEKISERQFNIIYF